jgi:hypothetical protein
MLTCLVASEARINGLVACMMQCMRGAACPWPLSAPCGQVQSYTILGNRSLPCCFSSPSGHSHERPILKAWMVCGPQSGFGHERKLFRCSNRDARAHSKGTIISTDVMLVTFEPKAATPDTPQSRTR